MELRIGGCACGDAPIPEEFYHHSKLVGVAGLRVRAAAVVSADAVDAAAKILAEMLRHSPPSILARLDAAGCAVSVIGREQKTSDIPEHRAWAPRGYNGGSTWRRSPDTTWPKRRNGSLYLQPPQKLSFSTSISNLQFQDLISS